MPYVIFNKQTNKYIKHPSTWVGRLSKATKFKTEENASNFLSCPPRALALPPIEALAILSTDNLTDIYNTSYSFTEETAQQEFEELKSYYEEMGYFSNEYKRPIPQYASRIGIVTASTGAAIHDILNIAHRRNPYVSLTLYPALVQGKNAAQSIAQGIRTLDAMNFDVIIVGRGGGSIEDLWAFNEEPVIEAVFNSNTPVISAVGHETDFTITDFVADLRAPTPSAAAELAVSDISVTQSRIEGYMELLNQLMERKLYMYRSQLENKKLKLEHLSPMTILDSRRHQLIQTGQRMENAMNNILLSRKHQLEIYASKLHGLSPLEKLSQGYSYVESIQGKPVNSVKNIDAGDKVKIYFKDGNVDAQVLEVNNGKISDN